MSGNIEDYVQYLRKSVETTVLMNGVDLNYYHPKKEDKSSVFNFDIDTPVFFMLSRMSKKKGVDVLLEAANILEQRGVGVKIIIAGSGPMSDDVGRMAEKTGNLEIFGRLTDQKLSHCYASADAFIFPSKTGEAFPTLTMMESYASGTPVIASDLVDEPIGVKESNTILIPPNDPEELADAMIKLANDKPLLNRMSKNARKSAEHHFSIESKVDQLEKLYKRTINS
ncbi:hypothetical protein Harman_33320 [Haloarcula mannanilytica]|uniref:Glycosyl transferase family 1 domain-containing protein n=1 Tax=Haloarcula mannanilytica TaxID=2509225 RepID=A0A4C2ENX9_9EURY|nr:hypothetical protein Harman_33320 [Haloarcula mannanilytica]